MIKYVDLLQDTICAPITAPGYSGVSVIRVSGDQAHLLTQKFFKKLSSQSKSHHAYFGTFTDLQQTVIDQVLVTYFSEGHSFTGDETIEISCHGNPLIVNKIIDLYLSAGCRFAERGEFSFRAFYNGKIDLIQAESIHQLVVSKNTLGTETSLKHLEGDLSDHFLSIEKKMVLAISHLEASIDFVEQDIEPEDYHAVLGILTQVSESLTSLIKTFDVGKNIKQGFKVLLLGPSNVGKSSLFNSLFREERAIVTDIAGTTRDIVTGQTFLGNNVVEFMDSAGVRDTSDPIEQIGIEKSVGQIQTSDLVLYVSDLTEIRKNKLFSLVSGDRVVVVLNKSDLVEESKLAELVSEFKLLHSISDEKFTVHTVSAKSGAGIENLKMEIEKKLSVSIEGDDGAVVTQARHYNHLFELRKHVNDATELISVNESPDLISQELSLGLIVLNQLIGKEYNDEILDKIFSEFCLGK